MKKRISLIGVFLLVTIIGCSPDKTVSTTPSATSPAVTTSPAVQTTTPSTTSFTTSVTTSLATSVTTAQTTTTSIVTTPGQPLPQLPSVSHFGVHVGGFNDFAKAAPYIKELGNIYVREELFHDSGWRHFKADKAGESSAFCKEYCVPTEYSDCACADGVYYADMHPDIAHVSGIYFYESNFNLLVTILNYTNSKKEPPNFESTYNTTKESVYKEYLNYLLTGMPNVRYWQIANEVDLAFWSGTAEEYLEMVKVSYAYIKNVNPEYQVGVSFNCSFNNLPVRWVNVLKTLGKQCDFIDAHLLPVGGMDMKKLNVMDLSGWRALCPDAELFSTETGLPDQKLHPDWGGLWGLGGTRDKQATDLVKYCTMLFDKGYDKIFWFLSDFDFEPIADDLFEHAGLVTNMYERKPSFYAYKTLISKVDGFVTVKKLSDSQYKYTFADRSPVYVLWGTGENALPIEITGTVTVTNIGGIESKIDISGLTLGDSPVFVEIAD